MNKITVIAAAALIGSLSVQSAAASQRYYGKFLCSYPDFTCVKVKRGDTWESLFPNSREREMVMRLNRTNMPLKYRSWIVIPNKPSRVETADLSPFPEYRKTNGKKIVLVSLADHAFGAYNQNGRLVHWGPISGGKGYCPDVGRACNTATGAFKVYRTEGKGCFSRKFPIETNGGAPMPYCMFFHKGFALHGSTLPGYHASHGCVRLFPEDAKWLNENFVGLGTEVIVTKT